MAREKREAHPRKAVFDLPLTWESVIFLALKSSLTFSSKMKDDPKQAYVAAPLSMTTQRSLVEPPMYRHWAWSNQGNTKTYQSVSFREISAGVITGIFLARNNVGTWYSPMKEGPEARWLVMWRKDHDLRRTGTCCWFGWLLRMKLNWLHWSFIYNQSRTAEDINITTFGCWMCIWQLQI